MTEQILHAAGCSGGEGVKSHAGYTVIVHRCSGCGATATERRVHATPATPEATS